MMENLSFGDVECFTNSSYDKSDLDLDDLHYVLRGPVLTAVIIAGLCGSLTSLIIFGGQKKTTLKICNYLMALETWNTILLTGSLFLYSMPMMLTGKYITHGNYVLVYPFLYTLTNVAYCGSIWSVVLLSAERYFALCKPLKHLTSWSSETRSKVLLGTSTALILIYQSPRFFEFVILRCYDFGKNEKIFKLDLGQMQADSSYRLFYKMICGLMFVSVGPLASLSIFCLLVWARVSQSSQIAQRLLCTEPLLSKRIKRRNRQMDRLMFAVIVKFCACHALPSVLDVCETTFDEELYHQYFIEKFVSDISNLLVCINSSCNFVIFYFCCSSFRRRLNMSCCLLRRAVGPDLSSFYNESSVSRKTSL